ncbi:acyltransferase family protein [Hymenobacter sp. HMF4947]|uniref:Acyltransferase family protein n=1 Tax=Hymenobacter ginkgonis TaxID=2682976 RepID=A0A7K1TEU9_9BACT|nr:acyltransferase [Hymenobacter ginkgonis]MVN76936.1 acyltransferase family protein [Hymenobacter ginkgonis]
MATTQREIKSLTGIRWWAAFFVFLFHLHSRVPITWLPWQAQNIISQGALGVNLFFMLSGFLLAYAHCKDFPEPQVKGFAYTKYFLFKRFARIYPVYLVGWLLSLVVSIGLGARPSALIIGSNLVFLQTYFPSIAMTWYGGGAWSIAVEIFFYLCFPLLLPVLLRIKQKSGLLMLLAGCAMLGFVPGLVYNLLPGTIPFTLQYAFPLCRLAEFTAGIITSILVFRFDWRVSNWVAALALMLGTIDLVYFGSRWSGFIVHNLLIIPVIALTLAAATNKSGVFTWLGKEPLVWLGKISYCFYMIQIPLSIWLDASLESGKLSKASLLIGPLALAVSLVGGALLHYIVEVPAHRFLMHRNRNPLLD